MASGTWFRSTEEEEDLFMEEEEEEEDLFGVGRVDRVLTHASHMYVLTP
jgi:hypothetical protein